MSSAEASSLAQILVHLLTDSTLTCGWCNKTADRGFVCLEPEPEPESPSAHAEKQDPNGLKFYLIRPSCRQHFDMISSELGKRNTLSDTELRARWKLTKADVEGNYRSTTDTTGTAITCMSSSSTPRSCARLCGCNEDSSSPDAPTWTLYELCSSSIFDEDAPLTATAINNYCSLHWSILKKFLESVAVETIEQIDQKRKSQNNN